MQQLMVANLKVVLIKIFKNYCCIYALYANMLTENFSINMAFSATAIANEDESPSNDFQI